MKPKPELLAGRNSSDPVAVGILQSLILLLLLTPFVVMGGGLLLLGASALSRETGFRELWVCFPAGITMFVFLAFFTYLVAVRVPQQTILEFQCGERLIFRTPAGQWNRALTDVKRIYRTSGGRTPYSRRGWTIEFADGQYVYLPLSVSSAEPLARALGYRPLVGC